MIFYLKKKFNKFFPLLFIFGELITLSLVYFAAAFIVSDYNALNQQNLYDFMTSIVIWSIFSYLNKNYDIGRATKYVDTLRKAANTLVRFLFILFIIMLFMRRNDIKREFLIFWVALFFVALPFYNLTVHIILKKYRAFGGNVLNVAIIGYDSYGFELYDLFLKNPQYGYRCSHIFSIKSTPKVLKKYPLSGTIDDFFKADKAGYDAIYVNGEIDKAQLNSIIAFSDTEHKKVKILPQFQTHWLKSYFITSYDNVAIVDVNNIPLDNILNRSLKRVFDIVFSSFVIVFFLSWMYPLFALMIKLQSRGPVIYKQSREGKKGIHFMCYKFRSMRLNDEADYSWAKLNDPRLTKFGVFLRKTSLDEFPQFFNVFLGDMSIVGPRPHPIKLNDTYRSRVEKFALRHQTKPGVTGLSQIKGFRGGITLYHQINARVRLDRFYIQNWSFLLDLRIILLTITALLQGQDEAY
ncbi:MAG: exopolysaccharide biosynthesis polyprenyl glycosylphosphotransferase [Flavobacteriales bacterium]|nr:exopolysaccharide biosynthesis polyprenyl glycosylphosphotransferase [Flavobacteriales bacterium]